MTKDTIIFIVAIILTLTVAALLVFPVRAIESAPLAYLYGVFWTLFWAKLIHWATKGE